MKIKRIVFFTLALLISLSSLLVFSIPQALAATKTWTGSAGDNKLATSGNWTGGAPANGDTLTIPYNVVFASCTADVSLTNDIAASGVTLAGIILSGARPTNCYNTITITGNQLNVSGDITSSVLRGATLNVPVTVTAPLTIQNVTVGGAVTSGSSALTLTDSTLTAGLSGSGGLIIRTAQSGGSGGGGCSGVGASSPVSGDSSGFSGAIQVFSGIIIPNSVTDIAHHATSITVESAGSVSFDLNNNQDMAFGVPLTLNGGVVYAQQEPNTNCDDITTNKTLTLTGSINATQTTTWTLVGTNIIVTGAVTGASNIKLASGLSSTVSLTLPGGTAVQSALNTTTVTDANKSTYCDATSGFFYVIQANNKFVINTDCTGTGTTNPIAVDGILGGNGKVGAVTVNAAGHIAPGNSPGCLSTGNLTVKGTYDQEIGGTTACTGYDQIKVIGTVDVTNGILNTTLYNGFKPAANQSYTIIDNDGSDAVTGTFKNLAEGATFSVSGYVFKITYHGGTGNDVVITVQSVPATPNTGFALIKSNPATTLGITIAAAGALLVLAKRKQYAKVSKVSKRR